MSDNNSSYPGGSNGGVNDSTNNVNNTTGGNSTTAHESTTTTAAAPDSRFSCNICFEPCQEPVVTQCGHLYCWPCLYRWIEPGMTPEDRTRLGLPHNTFSHSFAPINPGRRVCPVCKASTSVASLVPIYVRSNDGEEEVITTSNNDNSNTEPSPAKRARQTEETTMSAMDGIDDVDDLPDAGKQAESTGRTTTDQPIENDAVGTEMDATSESTNGLRQRLRFRSRDSEIPVEEIGQSLQEQQQNSSVPNRPAANTPQRDRTPTSPSAATATTPSRDNRGSYNMNPYRSANNNGANGSSRWMVTQMSPNGHGGSLTHGIMLSFAQATASAANGGGGQQQQQQNNLNDTVPSLHYPQNNNNDTATAWDGTNNIDVTAETTQYLSRLLIMLTSFVILCLLLL